MCARPLGGVDQRPQELGAGARDCSGCVPLVSLCTFIVLTQALTLLQLFVYFFLQCCLSFTFGLLVCCCFCDCGSPLLPHYVCALLVLHHLRVFSAWPAACQTAWTAGGTLHGSTSARGGTVHCWPTFNVTLFLRSISISIFVHLLSFLENLPTRYSDNYSWPTFH